MITITFIATLINYLSKTLTLTPTLNPSLTITPESITHTPSITATPSPSMTYTASNTINIGPIPQPIGISPLEIELVIPLVFGPPLLLLFICITYCCISSYREHRKERKSRNEESPAFEGQMNQQAPIATVIPPPLVQWTGIQPQNRSAIQQQQPLPYGVPQRSAAV